MDKIKLFHSDNSMGGISTFEKDINEWLKENSDIDVMGITHALTSIGHCVVMIRYYKES